VTFVEAPPDISVEDEITIDWEPRFKKAPLEKKVVRKRKAVAKPAPKASHRRGRTTLYLPLALLFQVLHLLPTLRTGWLGDDGSGYNYKAYLQFEHLHFWSDATNQAEQWIAAGRFYPVLFYQGYGIFYWVHSEVVYKSMIIAFTALASTALYLVLRRFRLPAATAALTIVIATCCIQLRDYHDAMLSYDGFIQILLVELCASMLLLDTWMKRGGWLRLVAATSLFAVACATYELAYVFVLLYVPVAINNSSAWKRKALGLVPPAVTSFGFVALALWLRAISTHKSDNYTPNYSFGKLASTFGKQEVGTFPGTFQIHAHVKELNSVSAFSQHASVTAVALGVAALILTAVMSWRSHSRTSRRVIAAPLTLGFMLLALPAIPLTIAPKYQTELEWGWSYLPVVFQVFGFGLILATLAHAAMGRRPAVNSAVIVVLATLVGIATVYDGSLNQVTATDLSKWKTLRHAQQSALQNGALDAAPDGSIVFASPPYYWETKYFFYRYADGKRFDARLAEPLTPAPTMEDAACNNRTDVAYVFESKSDANIENSTVAVKCFPLSLLR
jgi:hypothetical protein